MITQKISSLRGLHCWDSKFKSVAVRSTQIEDFGLRRAVLRMCRKHFESSQKGERIEKTRNRVRSGDVYTAAPQKGIGGVAAIRTVTSLIPQNKCRLPRHEKGPSKDTDYVWSELPDTRIYGFRGTEVSNSKPKSHVNA